MKNNKLTPIEDTRNFGPISGKALIEIGITTLEELKRLGWEQVAMQLCAEKPRFANLNMFRALIGATMDRDWRDIPEKELARARALIKALK